MLKRNDFSHLPLSLTVMGRAKFKGMRKFDARTAENRKNRVAHGEYIKSQVSLLSKIWNDKQKQRLKEKLPKMKTGIPLLLEIDPHSDVHFLKGLGFEVISELENGYVIVSNGDVQFAALIQKTKDFIKESSPYCNAPARVYAFHKDDFRLKKILGTRLMRIWTTIKDDDRYEVDVSISCAGNIFTLDQPPTKPSDMSEEEFKKNKKFHRWQQRYHAAYEHWDNLKYEREQQFENFIKAYDGEFIGAFVDNEPTYLEFCDSFSVRIKISGKGLKDLVYHFSPIFAIEYVGELGIGTSVGVAIQDEYLAVTIVPPDEQAPIVAVIDSGIQEEHQYIKRAIVKEDSKCYVKGTTSAADEVKNNGHGTRVAGAILYPYEIPQSGNYQLPCFIRNVRVLDENNTYSLRSHIFPPLTIKAAVKEFAEKAARKTKIFNHSITEISACEMKYMSPWAAEIDRQSYKNDILFIQAAGNIYEHMIKDFIMRGSLTRLIYWTNVHELQIQHKVCKR